MNIAVVFTKDAQEGGAFQYALSMSLMLKKNISDKYNFTYFTTVKKNLPVLRQYGLKPVYLRWSNLDRVINIIWGSQFVGDIFAKVGLKLELKLDFLFRKHNIDLTYFLSPTDIALAMNHYNYVFTVWDLCFMDCMEFPEVYINRQFERKYRLYRLALSKAIAVIVESEFTKQNIVKRFAVAQERILSLPLMPSLSAEVSDEEYKAHFVDIRKKYNINGSYIFYPAQFWPHKNHVYILEAMKILKEKYKISVHAVFSGSDKGNLPFVLRSAEKFGLTNQVRYIGFVDDKELPYLYRQAMALVMPTYFTPPNIPPLEAFVHSCPVLYSDLPDVREQVNDAVIFIDLKNPESLCGALMRIIERPSEIEPIINNGKRLVEGLRKEEHWPRLKSIFDDYNRKMKCWKD